MTPARFLRILRRRWYQVLAVGVAGALAGSLAAGWRNSTIEPTFEAVATVALIQGGSEKEAAFEARVSTALVRAREATAAILATDPRLSLSSNSDAGELRFGAQASTASEAENLASTLRVAYLTADPSGSVVEQIGESLDEIALEAETLEQQLEALTEEGAFDILADSQRRLISAQIASLEQRGAALALELAYPELGVRSPDEVQAEIDGIDSLLFRLRLDLAAIPEEESSPTEDRLASLALQRRLRDLETRYVDLSLRLADLTDAGGLADQVLVSDVTPTSQSVPVVAVVGLTAGALLGLLMLVMVDRLRRSIWTLDDIEAVAGIGIVPTRRPGAQAGRAWYFINSSSPRKRALQEVRASLEPTLAGGGVTLGVVGVGPREFETQAVAADLAAAVATSGRSVLVVDTSFDRPAALPEFGVDAVSLASIAELDADEESIRARIKDWLLSLNPVEPGLWGLRAGPLAADPVDALAGHAFRVFCDETRRAFEVTALALPDGSHPAAAAAASSIGTFVLVAEQGKTTEERLAEAVRALMRSGGRVLGVILLRSGRRRRPVRHRTARSRRGIGRLAADFASGRHVRGEEQTESEIDLKELESAEPTQARSSRRGFWERALWGEIERERLERRLAYLVVGVVGGSFGAGDEAAWRMASAEGVVPLVSSTNTKTVADRMVAAIAAETDLLSEGIEKALGMALGERDWSLDDWLAEELDVQSPLARLRSENRAYDALVYEWTLTPERLREVRDGQVAELRRVVEDRPEGPARRRVLAELDDFADQLTSMIERGRMWQSAEFESFESLGEA